LLISIQKIANTASKKIIPYTTFERQWIQSIDFRLHLFEILFYRFEKGGKLFQKLRNLEKKNKYCYCATKVFGESI